jgi:hypothetical protein
VGVVGVGVVGVGVVGVGVVGVGVVGVGVVGVGGVGRLRRRFVVEAVRARTAFAVACVFAFACLLDLAWDLRTTLCAL